MDWFLDDNCLRQEGVKAILNMIVSGTNFVG